MEVINLCKFSRVNNQKLWEYESESDAAFLKFLRGPVTPCVPSSAHTNPAPMHAIIFGVIRITVTW